VVGALPDFYPFNSQQYNAIRRTFRSGENSRRRNAVNVKAFSL
jgi:hypothetical protein